MPASPQKALTAAAATLAFASSMSAQAPVAKPGAFLVGNYQGVIAASPTPRRIIVRVFEGPDHRMAAYLVQLDQGGMDDRQIADTVQLLSSGLRAVFGGRTRYEVRTNADGITMTGSYGSGATTRPFTLRRNSSDTEYRATNAPAARFVTVAKDVQIEVLDWGGTGLPLVLLPGLGSSAHVFNTFAPKLAQRYRVLGLSRRGYGASTIASTGYRTDSLANDVLAVLDSLKLTKPVVAGWSFGGAEMSSIAVRASDRVSGLVYLDAGYVYAFQDTRRGDLFVSAAEVRRQLETISLASSATPAEQIAVLRGLRERTLPDLQRDVPISLAALTASPPPPPPSRAWEAVPTYIFNGMQKHTRIPVPVLAIYAYPHLIPPTVDSLTRAGMLDADKTTEVQALAFRRDVPTARVVLIPNANHAVFTSHEADVLREMHAFIDGLATLKQNW